MNSLASRRIVTLASLSLVLIILFGNHVQAQPATQQAANPTYQVLLPLVMSGSTGTPSPVDPVAVRFIHDPSRQVSAAVGPEGATLRATAADGTRFELVIAPDSLDFTETITMTPVLRAENLPLSHGLIGAVNLEPAGLELYQPAVLRVIPPTGAVGPLTIGFAYNDDGQQFHLRPLLSKTNAPIQSDALQPNEPVITMEIISIRPVGIGRGSQADLDAQEAQPAPSDPLDAAEQQVATKLEQALGTVFDMVVRPTLQQAETNDQLTDKALTTFDQWLRWVDVLDLRTRYISEFAEGKQRIERILAHSSANAAERCFNQNRPEEGFRLLRWVRYAKKYLSSADVAAIEAKLRGCLTFELTFDSHLTEQSPGYGYVYTLTAQKIVLQATTGTRATGSGPLNWLEFGWTGGGPCTFTTSTTPSTLDIISTPFGLTITPVSRKSPAVNITLHYNPGTPGEQTTIQCPGSPPLSTNSTGWKSYFDTMHANERQGNGYRVTSQIVGAGSFTGWVYHLTTTGPSGQEAVEDTQITIKHTPQR